MDSGSKMVAYQVNASTAIKDPTSCPQCYQTAEGITNIQKKFGLRKMTDGITRVQSWCRNCRKRKEVVV